MTFASITLSGILKNKAEQRFTANNVSVVSFTMEIDRYDSRAKEVKKYPVKANLWGDSHAQYLDSLVPGAEVIFGSGFRALSVSVVYQISRTLGSASVVAPARYR